MTARGAGFSTGGAVVVLFWIAINGWLSALAYTMGLVVGACVYANRAPWNL